MSKSYTLNGETKPLADWCRHYRIDYYLVYNRIKQGWTLQRALSTGIDQASVTRGLLTLGGRAHTLSDWCRHYKAVESRVRSRLYTGWPLVLALVTGERKRRPNLTYLASLGFPLARIEKEVSTPYHCEDDKGNLAYHPLGYWCNLYKLDLVNILRAQAHDVLSIPIKDTLENFIAMKKQSNPSTYTQQEQ